VVAEGNVQLLLDLRILAPMPLHEPEERTVPGAVAEDRRHFMAFGQVVPRGPEALVELHVVGVEHRVHVDALEIPAPLQDQVEQIPAPGPEG
jgi:hypothetical protein